MSEGVGPEPLTRAGGSRARLRWMPFWVMQATEIAVALVFAYLSVHVAHGDLLVISAVPLVVLAVTAQGPLGVFHLCSQRLHLWLAMGLSAVIALAPIIPALRPDIQGIIVIEFGAVGLFRVATLTRTGETRPAVRPGSRGRSRVIETTATVVEAGSSTPGPGSGPAPTADGTSSPSSGAAARWAGRTSGSAVATGKRVVADYRPDAEEQVKRTIRGIGKWAGRVSSRLAPPEDSGASGDSGR